MCFRSARKREKMRCTMADEKDLDLEQVTAVTADYGEE